MLAILPDASMSDLEIVRNIPSRFAERARAAEAAGLHAEAEGFAVWARAFATPPDAATVPVNPVLPERPELDTTAPSPKAVAPATEAMLQPALPPNVTVAREPEKHRAAGAGEKAVRRSTFGPVTPTTPVKRYGVAAADERCRAIVIRIQLGEEPSNVDRAYLRQGCQHS
jgi:hypothetical protein